MPAADPPVNTNTDERTVQGFGEEWARFSFEDQDPRILDEAFSAYFSIFPWEDLPANPEGFDAGCGSGRWAERVAPRVGRLHCVDASRQALTVAERKLSKFGNCTLHASPIDTMPLAPGSMDFGFSLGVLHHTPDPAGALRACASKLKPGAPFLLYLYYSLDNRSPTYRALWRASNLMRLAISRAPSRLRFVIADFLAATVYLPLAGLSRAGERLGFRVDAWPLSFYRNSKFYIMRNDSLDRFGTSVEHRFSRKEILDMMVAAGLANVVFSEVAPYWVALGRKVG